MPHRIEVAMKPGLADPAGLSLQERIAEDLDVKVGDVRVIDVYTINAELNTDELERVRTSCSQTRSFRNRLWISLLHATSTGLSKSVTGPVSRTTWASLPRKASRIHWAANLGPGKAYSSPRNTRCGGI